MKIEKGVPITKVINKTAGQGRPKNNFRDQMEVGDSYVVHGNSAEKVASGAWAWARYRKNGWRFSVRKQPDGSVRVWRVK